MKLNFSFVKIRFVPPFKVLLADVNQSKILQAAYNVDLTVIYNLRLVWRKNTFVGEHISFVPDSKGSLKSHVHMTRS